MSDPGPDAAPDGLRGALGRLGASAIALVQTRAELAATEFDEARERAKDRLMLVVVALVCFSVAILAATAFVVVLFWDTHRLVALAAVTVGYVAAGAIALWRFDVHRRTDPRPFAATLAELERDRKWLAGRTGEKR